MQIIEDRSGHSRTPWRLVAAVALALAAVSLLLWRWQGSSPSLPTVNIQALGVGLADATAHLLTNKGRIVVVAFAPDQAGGDAVRKQLAAFRDTLQQQSSIEIVAVKSASPPSAADTNPDLETAFDARLFAEILRTYHPLDAIVSFVGPPALEPDDFAKLAQPRPRLVVASNFTFVGRLKELVALNLVQVGVLLREDPVPRPVPAKPTARDWFAHDYSVLTPPAGQENQR